MKRHHQFVVICVAVYSATATRLCGQTVDRDGSLEEPTSMEWSYVTGSAIDAASIRAIEMISHVGPSDAGTLPADEGGTFPLSPGMEFRRIQVVAGGETPVVISAREARNASSRRLGRADDGADSSDAESGESHLVYRNDLGNILFGPYGLLATARFADDITTIGASGCLLDRYVIFVSGDSLQDGTGAGPYSVTAALHSTCPGAFGGGMMTGTQLTVTFPDNGTYALEVVIPPHVEVPLPQSSYLSVQFSRELCGTVAGAPASLGFSADRFDFPSFGCAAGLGGFPIGPHASFGAEVFVRGACAESFPGYRVSRQSGAAYNAGAGVRFADQLRLTVANCRLTAWEIAHKGAGIIQADVRTALSITDPDDGFLIEGTRALCSNPSTGLQICRHDLTEPVDLPAADLFMVFQPDTSLAGPVNTCRPADLGDSANDVHVYSGGQWTVAPGPTNCPRNLDITLYCEGQPPIGACCDMVLRDPDGQAVCRERPKMNCAFPERWVEGAYCGAKCQGGDSDAATCTGDGDCPGGSCSGSFCGGGENDGLPCTRAVDCPDGSCEGGPFAYACGLAACCKPDDTCEDLTRNECFAIEPVGTRRYFDRNHYCADNACPFTGCATHTGACMIAHPEPGCRDTDCCHAVCDEDPTCCQQAWTGACVRLAQEHCRLNPENAVCYSPEPEVGALDVEIPSTTVLAGKHPFPGPGPEYYCAHSGSPGYEYSGWCDTSQQNVWFRFRAKQTSARISTCGSGRGYTLIQVFRAHDPSTEQTACESLEAIACNDVNNRCAYFGLADVCATNLVPGETYYVVVGGEPEDLLQVDFSAPCTSTDPPVAGCAGAVLMQEPIIPIGHSSLIVQCPAPRCDAGSPDQTDRWYQWVAAEDTPVTATLCLSRTPARLLTVYDGCDCPLSIDDELGCAYPGGYFDVLDDIACEHAAQFSFRAAAGQCYTFRVTESRSFLTEGYLILTPASCPPVKLTLTDPPVGVVEAGRFSNIWRIFFEPAVTTSHACWSLCETAAHPELHPAYSPYDAVNRPHVVHDGWFSLVRTLTPGEATTIVYTDDEGHKTSATYYHLPGDVNGDGFAGPADILSLIDAINGVYTLPWGPYSRVDNYVIRPNAIPVLIDILNEGWLNVRLPGPVPECPED